ncbi:hypothetical protein ACN28I_31180 [Archangium gephyra]|uniref:hypothetical protein n=1 Tax=Archangium gephyra TaxID=48 RepID=UPI003B7881E8
MAEPGDQTPSEPETSPPQGENPSFWREGRAALQLVFQSRLVLLIVFVLTFVASLQFLLGGRGINSLDLLSPDPMRLWHLLVALQPTLWLASMLGVFGELERRALVWPGSRRERLALVFCTAFISGMAFLPVLTPFLGNPFSLPANAEVLTGVPHMRAKMFVFYSLGSVAGVLLTSGMLSVHIQLAGGPPRNPSGGEQPVTGSLEREVLRYQRLRAQLKRCLGFAGGIISASVLTVSTFHNAITGAVPTQPGVFPATAAMGFGIYFTAFLAIIYLPASKTLSEAGEALAARLVPPSPGAHTPWKHWSEERQAVRTYLGLEGSALQELQQGLTLLSPFIASLSTLLLGTGR